MADPQGGNNPPPANTSGRPPGLLTKQQLDSWVRACKSLPPFDGTKNYSSSTFKRGLYASFRENSTISVLLFDPPEDPYDKLRYERAVDTVVEQLITGNLIRGDAKDQLLMAKSAHDSGNMFKEAERYERFSLRPHLTPSYTTPSM